MRKDKLITINSKTSKVFIDNAVLGVDSENLQGNLIFSFDDEFVDGTARLEIEIKGTKSYAMMTKEEETYTLPIKSFLTKEGRVNMQVVITEGTDVEEIPIFKSNVFFLVVNSSINAEIEQEEGYDEWIDIANAKLNQLDSAIEEANNLDIEAEKVDTTTTITITKKDGTTEEVEIQDGERGADGQQGIDGVGLDYNWQGTSLGVKKENESEYEYVNLKGEKGDTGTNDYNDLINKPDLSQFITKSVDDLINYYKKSETYTQTEVNNLIGAIQQFHYEIVQELPETGVNNILYLVPKTASQTNNVYDEYVYANNNFEKIGDTQIDLTNYVTTTQLNTALADYTTTSALNTLLAGKQDTLTAGDNITIENSVISATNRKQIYILTGEYTNANSNQSINSTDIATLNSFIDDLLSNKEPMIMLKNASFWNNNTTQYTNYNIIGQIRYDDLNNTLILTFRPTLHISAYNEITSFKNQVRTIQISNPTTPSSIQSATLSSSSNKPTIGDCIVSIDNRTSFTPNSDYNLVHKKYVDDSIANIDLSSKQDIIQYSTMPTASSSNEGNIVQFIGTTTNDYINGYFYKCVSSTEEVEGETITTYSWENINIQETSDEGVKKSSITFVNGTVSDNTIYEELQEILDYYTSHNNNIPPLMTTDGYILYNLAQSGSNSTNNWRSWYVYFYKLNGSNFNYYQIYFYTNYTSPYIVYKYNEGHDAYTQGKYNINYLTSHQSLSNYLAKNNTTAFTPTGDYNPATKKYVDDSVGNIDLTDYLAKDNTEVYTPTSSYNPCTKLYAETYANNLFNALNGLNFEIVATLPASNISTTTIYLQGSANPYNMYVYVNNNWELLGTTQIDINPEIITNSSSTYTITTLNGNKSYKLGEIEELIISAITTFDRESIIYFTSGATPTEISIPDSLINLGDVPELTNENNVNVGTCEEDKSYIISILNNIAVWKAY